MASVSIYVVCLVYMQRGCNDESLILCTLAKETNQFVSVSHVFFIWHCAPGTLGGRKFQPGNSDLRLRLERSISLVYMYLIQIIENTGSSSRRFW